MGAGLSSSAALGVALCLALGGLAGREFPVLDDRLSLAALCSRIENDWVGARTGLLDQIASLFGEPERAVLIDFRTLEIRSIPLRLAGHRLVTVDSGESHTHAASGYNERRDECNAAARMLGLPHLSDASLEECDRLPDPLRRRARHVVCENARVLACTNALAAGDMKALGAILTASHASLRDDFQVSTPIVERTVQQMLCAGALGARLIGGGFGGHVLGPIPPGVPPPPGATDVRAGPGACVR